MFAYKDAIVCWRSLEACSRWNCQGMFSTKLCIAMFHLWIQFEFLHCLYLNWTEWADEEFLPTLIHSRFVLWCEQIHKFLSFFDETYKQASIHQWPRTCSQHQTNWTTTKLHTSQYFNAISKHSMHSKHFSHSDFKVF